MQTQQVFKGRSPSTDLRVKEPQKQEVTISEYWEETW